MPEARPTVAIAVLLLAHEPPPNEFDNTVVPPLAQALGVPVIAGGVTFTTKGVAAIQVDGKVYVMAAVPPETPVTTPVEEIEATVGLELDHVPAPASIRLVVYPTQTLGVPPIAAGNALTVTVVDAGQIDPGGA
jgi:hypothetical protein